MPKISVIVSVYNCEKYISKCIKSILGQTFEDLEIILIDDGSTDKSFEICNNFAQKDRRIKLIHQNNGGVSKARNVGLDAAQGEFIAFVDGDDYIVPDMYERMYKNLIKNKADISICGITNCFIKKNGTIKKVPQSKEKGFFILTGKQAMKESLKSKLFSVNPVNKLFKRKLFESARYPEGKISEDAFLIPSVIFEANIVVYDSTSMYCYIRHENSITTSDFSSKDWDVVEAYENHFKITKKNFPDAVKAAEFRYLWSYTYVMDRIVMSTSEVSERDFKRAFCFIKKNIFKIVLNPYFSVKRKIITVILLLNKKIYKKIITKLNK